MKKRCADCGLLAARDKQSRQLVEVEDEFRFQKSRGPDDVKWLPYTCETVPLCCGMEDWFSDKVHTFLRPTNLEGYHFIEFAIQWENDCKSFTRWRPGHSPKEHLAMSIKEEEEVKTRAWQEQIRAEERRWREGRERRDFWSRCILGVVTTILGAAIGYLFRGQSPPVVNVIVPEQKPHP